MKSRKVIVLLSGGLGNQLFQYGCSQALARLWRVPLILDISNYTTDTGRTYALAPYKLPTIVLTQNTASGLTPNGIFGRLIDRIFADVRPRHWKETVFHYDPRIASLSPPVFLDGYWQSERYFLNSRSELLKQLTVGLTGANVTLAHGIQEKNSVAVHVRRGDYLSNPAASTFHGVCDAEYYRRAANEIEQQVAPVHYYLFGDDPAWARENLAFLRPATIVNLNSSTEAHLDLELMRRCKHHIIANSTFSWWGAWLSDVENKIVIAPSRWFLDESIDTRDLIPTSWIRL